MESQAQGNILSVGTNLLAFTETLKFFPKDGDTNWRSNSKKWGCNGTTSQRPIFSELDIHETAWCSTLYTHMQSQKFEKKEIGTVAMY